tara:strand:+ start:8165 stop:8977 length:813 start_codon:yes stop_codon:yes gene_type:complete
MITGSVVTFHTSKNDLQKVIDSFLGEELDRRLFVIDNSSDNRLSVICNDDRIHYIFNSKNIGFGAAHNVAFQLSYKLNVDYHITLNPDISFNPEIIDLLITKANSDQKIGMIMPKIIYPDGKTQYLCKLLPTPFDLILRRFFTFKKIKTILNEKYELRFTSYEQIMEPPVLSGCFMFLRLKTLKQVSGFDTRYFMYLEDVDLCRKIGELSKLVYYPDCEVVHNYEKGSYSNLKLLKFHIKSAIKYFNKWGWIFDKKRKEINTRTLKQLNF